MSYSYRSYRDDAWQIWALPERWNPALWRTVQDRIDEQSPSKHPQTVRLLSPGSEHEEPLFLKIFHRESITSTLKDVFRNSKALRGLQQGRALAAAGFNSPIAIAAGEQRKYRLLNKSFLLTAGISGWPLPVYLRDRQISAGAGRPLRWKENALKELAAELSRFHALGFVHGDLIPWNILVSEQSGDGISIYFMDNDRTANYPSWIPQRRWRRNLVQLNRFPLPGVTLQHRLRFLRLYLSKEQWDTKDRRLISWLERKTRQRRWACDRIAGPKSFRELMRWNRETMTGAGSL